MDKLRQAAEQALNALEGNPISHAGLVNSKRAIVALRDALENGFNPDWDAMAVMVEEQMCMAKRISELEAQTEQEPVAWMEMVVANLVREGINKHKARELAYHFAAPPKRLPLTDEQVNECGMCGYVGKDKDKTGQCPKCRWDELRPLTGKAHQKPLTDDQIYEMYNEPRSDAEMLEFARAIEAHHGIGEKK